MSLMGEAITTLGAHQGVEKIISTHALDLGFLSHGRMWHIDVEEKSREAYEDPVILHRSGAKGRLGPDKAGLSARPV
jgi:hypothetical protein